LSIAHTESARVVAARSAELQFFREDFSHAFLVMDILQKTRRGNTNDGFELCDRRCQQYEQIAIALSIIIIEYCATGFEFFEKGYDSV
jgi:hypothetical protein